MSAVEYYVDVVPSMTINNTVQGLKNYAMSVLADHATDPQVALFLQDPPHYTLFTGRTEQLDTLANVLLDSQDSLSPFAYQLDPIVWQQMGEFHELRFPVKRRDVSDFRELQRKLLEVTALYRTEQPPTMFNLDLSMDVDLVERINNYHYPHIGEHFVPHISVGRINNSHKDLLKGEVPSKMQISGPHHATELRLNVYRNNNPQFLAIEYKRFGLGGKQ